jgi:cyclopropane fatty-acyl-phospholipid synthase-like methyltransferase
VGKALTAGRRARAVEAAYDELGARFGEWMAKVEGEPLDRFLGELTASLTDGARILELGCGDGRTTKLLVGRFDVVGVDLSTEQLRLARGAVPEATFIHADFLELEFDEAAFDAVTAFYSFMHVPRDRHAELLGRIRSWLKPGGLFLAPLSTIGGPDRVEHWLGVDMFFSGWDAETNRNLVRAAGLDLLVAEVIPMREPHSVYETAFLWVLAQKPA